MSVSQAAAQLVEVVKNKKEEGQSQLGKLALTSVNLDLIRTEQSLCIHIHESTVHITFSKKTDI